MRNRACVLTALVVILSVVFPLAAEPPRPAAKKPLTLEEIYSEAGLTGRMPTQLRWSPDGRLLAYLLQADEGEQRDLWVVDAASGEKRILVSYDQLTHLAPSAEQATRDERERERLLRYAVASYVWSPDSESLLFTSAGQLYLFDLASGQARLLAGSKRDVGDPKFSPDGKWVAFVYEHDLWLVPTEGGAEKRLTLGGNENILHGELDWVYPEELGIRSGYAWSPDSRRLAFLELDEHPVPAYPIVNWVPVEAPVDFQRYPKAGDPNPKARIGIVDVTAVLARPEGPGGAEVVWLDRAAEYIPRFAWADPAHLAVQLLNRAQTEIELILADAATGRSRSLLVERDPYWINVTDDLNFLPGAQEFLWSSERTGFSHIYVYGLDGALKRTLTSGEWEVGGIVGVDEAAGWVYYTSTERNPLGSDLYRVKLDASAHELLSEARGSHSVVMNGAATAYADTFSALNKVPEIAVRDLASGRTTAAHTAKPVDAYEMVNPELLELKAADGALVRGLLFKPPRLEPKRRYPVLVHVYGGPHAPTIRDSWGGSRFLFHQYLVQQGFLVMQVDDRASSLLGHKYEAAIHRRYGPTALADQQVAVTYLRSLLFVDPERLAVWGWSGGGFSTCFFLTHSDFFKVGIAVAPVTDWRLYDSIYTERYMGLPQDEPGAYKITSAVAAAANLHGRLLLVHGDADDNVHIHNSLQFIDALIKAGKHYDLWVYPQKTHSLRGAQTQLHLFRRITEYLKAHL